MVWLISFLTISNIALGYGLAVYMQRQFGMMMPPCRLRSKRCDTPAVAKVAEEATTVQTPKTPETKPAETSTPPSAGAAEEASGLPPVDEENVLAGIEEFRSQLAKMNVTAEEGETAPPKEVEPEPIATTN